MILRLNECPSSLSIFVQFKHVFQTYQVIRKIDMKINKLMYFKHAVPFGLVVAVVVVTLVVDRVS